jgi:5-methyltetrahydrofolate--homocysteine methyltransferase
MINSVNGKQASMNAVFPLAKKYGGLVVALTLDEAGIPATAEDRWAIAKKILKEAKKYGLGKKDLIFDPLAMTISSDPAAAKETLKALRLLQKNGCRTSLGVSNISFGLPARDAVNGAFFALAMENGLNAAILNVYSAEMMKAYHAFNALHDLDQNCGEYIRFATTKLPTLSAAATPAVGAKSTAAGNEGRDSTPLQRAIVKGLKEQAAASTKELLAAKKPLEIIDGEIIPALDVVGKGFEQKTLFLPQLLMSAEAAKAAFEVIKTALAQAGAAQAKRSKFVIATVYGDIHDIGKNIVKVILENYGFDVIDLGKDVPPEKVADAVVENHAPMAGLSALMTTTVPSMEATIRLLRERAPWCKIVVGGAVMTQEYADKIGADKYAKDAMETVRYAEEMDKGG